MLYFMGVSFPDSNAKRQQQHDLECQTTSLTYVSFHLAGSKWCIGKVEQNW